MPDSSPSITLHYLSYSGRAQRVAWLLEELGLPYTAQIHFRAASGESPASLREVTPLGKSPAIVVDGEVLVESGAIVHYLLDKFSAAGLERPASQASTRWAHVAEGGICQFMQPSLVAEQGAKRFPDADPAPTDWFVKRMNANVERYLDEIEAWLQNHDTFSGTPGVLGEGDFMMMFPLNLIAYGGQKGRYQLRPATAAYVDRMRARPAYTRALQTANPAQANPDDKT